MVSLRLHNSHIDSLNDKKRDLGILLFLVALAALSRAPGLGTWCVNSDEYLLSRSIAYIQDTGLPRFPSGGYYVRGILYQYLIAIPVGLFEDREFALRLWPLVFGILTVPAMYLFCKKMMPTLLAFACCMILVLSSWHLEFSRFARFYSAFQFLFFVFLYYLYSGISNDNNRHRLTAIAVSFVAIFVFEAAIFLPFIFLTTYLFAENGIDRKSFLKLLYIFAILVAINLLANGGNYRNIGVANALPLDLAGKGPNSFLKNLPVNFPTGKLVAFVLNFPILIAVYGLLCCLGTYLAYHLLKREGPNGDFWASVCILGIAVLPLFHLFTVLGFVLILLFVNRIGLLNLYRRNMKFITLYVGSAFLFWVLVIALSGNANKVMHYLVGYPPMKQYVIAPYRNAIPVWALGAVAILIVSTIRVILTGKNHASRFVLTVLTLCIFLLPVFKQPEFTTRYSFFFYPLVIVLWCLEADSLNTWYMEKGNRNNYGPVSFVIMGAPFLLFMATDDFNVSHLKNVSAKEANFRMGKYERWQEHWYERFDYESPASFVNAHYGRGDAVVVDSNPFDDYLKVPFYFYSPDTTHWFRQFSRNFGTEEIWSGKPMLRDLPLVVQLVPADKRRSLWLVSKEQMSGGTYVADFARDHDLNLRLEYAGIDNRFKVWKLNRKRNLPALAEASGIDRR